MTEDPQRIVTLTVVPSEVQAEILVAALHGEGIDAEASGGLTSGFRAEAPGGVRILVRAADLEAATRVLAEEAAARADGAGGEAD